MTWTTSPFEYGVVLVVAVVAAGYILPFMSSFWLIVAVAVLGLPSAYALLGLGRPRQVSLTVDAMIIRPVIGQRVRYRRQDIVSVHESVTVPLGTLVARIRNRDGRVKGVTVQNRLVLAGGSVRDQGRLAGMHSSAREKLLVAWAGLDVRLDPSA